MNRYLIFVLFSLLIINVEKSFSQIMLITDHPNGVCEGDVGKYNVSKPFNTIIDEYRWFVNDIEQNIEDSLYLSTSLNNNDELFAIVRARIDDTIFVIDTTNKITIQKYPKPSVDIGEDVNVAFADNVYLLPIISGGTQPYFYNWMYENNTVFSLEKDTYIKAENTIVVKFKVIDFNQCEAVDEKKINVENFDDLFIPNAFCPSGLNGSENTRFYAQGHGIETINLYVYNKNGTLIFENNSFNDASKGWDGTYNGQVLNSDAYTYLAIVKYSSKKEEVKKGTVYLLR